MPIAKDLAQAGGYVTSGTSITKSHTCTGASLLLVGLSFGQSSFPTSGLGVTYNGVALTQAIAVPRSLGYWESYIYYLINPAGGANNVVASWTGAAHGDMQLLSLQGTDLTAPIRDSDGTEFFSGIALTKTLDASAIDWCFAVRGSQGGATFSSPLTDFGDQDSAQSEGGEGSCAGATIDVTLTPGYSMRGSFAAVTIKAAPFGAQVIMF